jgi:hypothetical protein
MKRMEAGALFFALMFLVAPILVLAWPPRRRVWPASPPAGEGV